MAVSLPLFVQPVVLDGLSWCDGGIVDIFPVAPVLDIEPAVDTAIAVNGFYPHEFRGEDVTGWNGQPLSIITAASQVRTCQQAELAREHLARLRRQARTLLVEPVPYWKVAGTGFYEQFLDTCKWPQFMRGARGDARLPAPARSPVSRVALPGRRGTRSTTIVGSAGIDAGRATPRSTPGTGFPFPAEIQTGCASDRRASWFRPHGADRRFILIP